MYSCVSTDQQNKVNHASGRVSEVSWKRQVDFFRETFSSLMAVNCVVFKSYLNEIYSFNNAEQKKATSLCSLDWPVFQRCTTCELAACWSPPLFPLTLSFLEQMPRCRHTADTLCARCCGTGGIRHCMTGRRGALSHVVNSTPAAVSSGWRRKPHCEELKGHLEKDDGRWKGSKWKWKPFQCLFVHNNTVTVRTNVQSLLC